VTKEELPKFNAAVTVICGCSGGWVFNKKNMGSMGIVCGPARRDKPINVETAGMNATRLADATEAFLNTLLKDKENTIEDARIAADKALQKTKEDKPWLGDTKWKVEYGNGFDKTMTLMDVYKKVLENRQGR
jgi:hypothetical protein